MLYVNIDRWSDLFKLISKYDMTTIMQAYSDRYGEYVNLRLTTYDANIMNKCLDDLLEYGYNVRVSSPMFKEDDYVLVVEM